jgi:DNA polymerase/3'-5' exonuclease PolX
MPKKMEIVTQLFELSEWETNPFKKRAYLRASQIISGMKENEFYGRENYLDIPGIGQAINDKILQFKSSGEIKKWRELSEKFKAK